MLFILSIICIIISIFLPNNLKGKKIFLNLISFILILISGLRNEAVGIDTYRYITFFKEAKYISLGEILSNFIMYYINPTVTLKDPGYMIVEKLISLITDNQVLFLLIISSICILSFKYFFDKCICKKDYLVFAYLFYIALLYSNYPNQILRQSLAISIILIGYVMLKNNKLKEFVLMIVVASFFHKSSLIVLIVPLLYKFVKTKYILILTPLLFMSLIFFPNVLELTSGVVNSYYDNYFQSTYYGSNNKPIMIFITLIGLYLMIVYQIVFKKFDIEKYKLEFIGCSLSVMLLPGILIDPNLFRLISYFIVWYCVFIPVIISEYKIKTYLLYIVYVILLVKNYNSPEYKFYWQHMDLNEVYDYYVTNTNKDIVNKDKMCDINNCNKFC